MTIRIAEARWPDDRATVEALFREYVASLAEDISFQNVDDELAGLPGKYARPGGVVLIAWDGERACRRDRVPHVRAGRLRDEAALRAAERFAAAASRASLPTS